MNVNQDFEKKLPVDHIFQEYFKSIKIDKNMTHVFLFLFLILIIVQNDFSEFFNLFLILRINFWWKHERYYICVNQLSEMKIDDKDIMILICTHVITINCTCMIIINRSGVVAYRRLRWIRTVWRQLNNVSKNIVYEERHQLFINWSFLYLYLHISQLKLPP